MKVCDGPIDELYHTDCPDCGQRLEIVSGALTSATVRCECGTRDIDLDGGEDEAAVYY